MENLAQFETVLWDAADELRANSNLPYNEYFLPVMGIIFLRHAANRFAAVDAAIQAERASGKLKRAPVAADYIKRRSLFLPVTARYETILAAAKDRHIGQAVDQAMADIEEVFPPLKGVLPKGYSKLNAKLLEDLMKTFNSESIRAAAGDVFGRIYEYFLRQFAMKKAHDDGEFFTPPSLVQTIVNVIEPGLEPPLDPVRGVIVADLACGSAGMFVQTSHFVEELGGLVAHKIVFYGYEKTSTTIQLAKMNLAVHGLEGHIAEANTYYEDPHTLVGHCDRLMANPPFNVDKIDATKVKEDTRRLPFGLPGVNKQGRVSNGNYVWISYFYSYLNPRGRAGFVMSAQASSAGGEEKTVRRKLIQTGHVDVMISIRNGFFYTRPVPCELWFLDKNKPQAPSHGRGGYDFSGLVDQARELRKKQTPAEDLLWELIRNRQLADLKFRRQHQIGDYLVDFYCHEYKLVVEIDGGIHKAPAKARQDVTRQKYLESLGNTVIRFRNEEVLNSPQDVLSRMVAALPSPSGRRAGDEGDVAHNHKGNVLMLDARHVHRQVNRTVYDFSPEQLHNLAAIVWLYRGQRDRFLALVESYREKCREHRRALAAALPPLCGALEHLGTAIKGCAVGLTPQFMAALDTARTEVPRLDCQIRERDYTKDPAALPNLATVCKSLTHLAQQIRRASAPLVEAALHTRVDKENRTCLKANLQECEEAWQRAVDAAHANTYFTHQIDWLLHRFPDARFRDVPGLCKAATRAEIEAADWSLSPGRYVGIAPVEEDADFDFEETMRGIHTELATLNEEASGLARAIQSNFEELGA